MNDSKSILPPHLRPRVIVWARGFDCAAHLREFDLAVDVAWKAGDVTPIDSEPEPHDGFAVYLIERPTELWRQEEALLDFLHEHYIELSSLQGEAVDVLAVLFMIDPDGMLLCPPLMGMLAGLGVALDLRPPEPGANGTAGISS